jgi:hypothetical protein
MSTPAIPTAREVQDHVRGAVRKGQEAALEAIKSVAGTVSALAPKIPAKVSDLTRPLAEALPNPEAVVAKVYDLAEKALSEQRRLMEEALKATAALRPAAKDAGAAKDAHADAQADAAKDADAVSRQAEDETAALPSREPTAE